MPERLSVERVAGAAARAPRAAGSLPPFLPVVAAIVALAFLIRLVLLLRGGGLTGDVVYDDGVHYSAADALVHGRLPYRDFLFLQSPGILLFLAPFAALGAVTADPIGLALARLAFLAVGALNAGLVASYGRRFGRTTAVVAGLAYAVFHPAVFAERAVLLEPLGTAFILLAALLAARSRDAAVARPRLLAALSGAAGAAAAGVKIWYVVPLLVLLAFERRHRSMLLLGAAAGGAVIVVPFLAADPAAMVRNVVLDQLGRPRHPDWTIPRRLESLVGLASVRLPAGLAWLPPRVLAVVLLGLLLLATVATATVPGARVLPVLLLTGVVVLLASPSYFPHYVALTAPWTVLIAAIGARRAGSLVPLGRLGPVAPPVLVLAAVVLVSFHQDMGRVGQRIPAAVLAPAARTVRCVTTDDPVLLAAMNVLSADLARGCPLWPDLTGWTYDRDKGYGPGIPKELSRRRNAPWQRDVLGYLTSGQAVILNRPDTGLDRTSTAVILHGRVLARSGHWVLRAAAR